ncbi:MAG TPA: M28 family peptidase [Pyrinomonadaceae bacterium]|nr:M28 family peptidase [Pyrinomonadaceae bacterium]
MKRHISLLVCLLLFAGQAHAQTSTLLPDATVAALAQEISGEAAKRNLEYLSRQHRMRGSRGFNASAEFIVEQLRAYGLADARVERFAADGIIFYGTQRSRPPWDAEFAELWEMRETANGPAPAVRLASWDAMPLVLAQDSESADVVADLVDVGGGTSEKDYEGKDVRGKIALVSSQPGTAAKLAVEKYGATGLISYAQNQRTAWYGEDENLIRWGHLDTFAAKPTFAFMVSLKQARAFKERLARGERIRLRASVRAGKHAGAYDVVTATIPGADPRLAGEEVAFSCHLDHPRPGANDNASGSATILEVARTFSKLIAEKKIARPARTIRFIWPAEIEGTLALLNARPDIARRIKAVVHMDMVGGGPETKAVFHVTRGPASMPSFVGDVAEHFGELVNEQSARFASGESAAYPLVAPEGGKEALLAEMAEYSAGSDHDVYADSSFGVPVIYLNDWPDRYIHTNFDTVANIDSTKLKRAAFIGAASAYFLAGATTKDAPTILQLIQGGALRRTSRMLARRATLAGGEADNLVRFQLAHERATVASMERFFKVTEGVSAEASSFLDGLRALVGGVKPASAAQGDGRLVFRRNPNLKGPMSAFGYDYFADKYGAERAETIRLLNFQGARGGGGEYAYEVLNFADGRRNAQEIRDAVSAEFGPVPLDLVVEYLRALESIGVVERQG